MDNKTEQGSKSRRDFIKKLAYMPPAIATLTVLPAFHASGSGLTGTTGGGGNDNRNNSDNRNDNDNDNRNDNDNDNRGGNDNRGQNRRRS